MDNMEKFVILIIMAVIVFLSLSKKSGMNSPIDNTNNAPWYLTYNTTSQFMFGNGTPLPGRADGLNGIPISGGCAGCTKMQGVNL